MPSHISPEKMQKAEHQIIDALLKMWNKTQENKIWVRLITTAVILVAIYQELGTDLHLTNSWKEITIYLLFGYFGIAMYRNVFRIFTQTHGGKNE